jgi:hypothetical protein
MILALAVARKIAAEAKLHWQSSGAAGGLEKGW